MRILFFPDEFPPIHANLLDERPLSGGPTTLIRLSSALAEMGHEVIVLTADENPSPSNPKYYPYRSFDKLGAFDLFVAVRGWMKLFLPIEAKKRAFWTGDSITNPKTYGIGDLRFIQHVDRFLAKSQWHAESLCQGSGFPSSKMKVFLNGIYAPYFQKKLPRQRKRLLYSSTPNRGLEFLIPIFRRIREGHPDAELHVYSSFDRNSREWPSTDLEEPIIEVVRKEPGWVVHDSVLQEKLAEAYLQGSLLVYPCNFPETCASTTLEAQAAGCPIVTTALASLPETVGKAGVLISGDPNERVYQDAFVEAVDKLLTDDQLWDEYSKIGLKQAQKYDWKIRAAEFLKLME